MNTSHIEAAIWEEEVPLRILELLQGASCGEWDIAP